jgi:uncharacterized membrane protein
MFQKVIDDLKAGLRAALQATALVSVAAIAALAAFGFLCAAGFVLILDRYGPIAACLAGAGLFLLIAIVLFIFYVAQSRQSKQRAMSAQKSAQAALMDPTTIATGVQIVRAIGLKRLAILLAVGGIAVGLFTRSASQPKRDEQSP